MVVLWKDNYCLNFRVTCSLKKDLEIIIIVVIKQLFSFLIHFRVSHQMFGEMDLLGDYTFSGKFKPPVGNEIIT